MKRTSEFIPTFIAHPLIFITFVILIIFSYAYFNILPYIGFSYNPSSGEVQKVFSDNPQTSLLQPGDRLLRVGDVTLEQFRTGVTGSLFEGTSPGQAVELLIQRDDKERSISWILPGKNRAEVLDRLSSQWWISYIFWLFGTLALLMIRPRDIRCALYAFFNYLTALWLLVGSITSQNLWGSPMLLQALIWFCIPVYWQFHWNFPQPLKSTRKEVWVVLYLLAACLSLGVIFHFIPLNLYFIGFILAIVGSVFLFLAQMILYPSRRRPLTILGVSIGLILLPIVGTSLGGFIGHLEYNSLISMIALPLLPGFYFYAIYRYRLGGMELVANRLIVWVIYIILLFSSALILIPISCNQFPSSSGRNLMGVAGVLFLALVSIFLFPSFDRWVEKKLLGIEIPPNQLLEKFSEQILLALDEERLFYFLSEQIFPFFRIRQAALLIIDRYGILSNVLRFGVEESQLPAQDDLPELLSLAREFRGWIRETGNNDFIYPWVRLVLKLSIGDRILGLLLLGKRDPDDFYSIKEIRVLQMITNQTALAMVNIEQSKLLSALYKNDIQRQEAEMSHLALELHDVILGDLANLAMSIEDMDVNPQFEQTLHSIANEIRHLIQGLRPIMLQYGLSMGLRDLVEELATQTKGEIAIKLEIPATSVRYPAEVELHLYRIIQQACQNVIKHARAKSLTISGLFEEDHLEVRVIDDGIGFMTGGMVSREKMLSDRHFGLAGMYERAALVGAQLLIESVPDQGIQVIVTWTRNRK